MIREHVSDLALQMGIELTKVSVIDGHTAGCSDVHLLHLSSGGHMVSALAYQSELENLANGNDYRHLSVKIRSALSRLRTMLES